MEKGGSEIGSLGEGEEDIDEFGQEGVRLRWFV